MLRKVIFLIAILAIPAAIFVFLKIFGNNQFEVPMYYQDEGFNQSECEDIVTPYSINGRLREVGALEIFEGADVLHVFVFIGYKEDAQQQDEKLYNLLRISDALGEKLQSLVIAYSETDSVNNLDKFIVNGANDEFLKIHHTDKKADFNCAFLLQEGLKLVEEKTENIWNLMVLTDASGIIRGYYNALSREDTDRLIVESKILVKMN